MRQIRRARGEFRRVEGNGGDGATLNPSDAIAFPFMADDASRVHNADAPWNNFSSHDYWRRNYHELQAEDQEIIRRVSQFFIHAFAGRAPVQRGIDVGSGTNLYPALLMLPWTEQILLTDFSASNVDLAPAPARDDDGDGWTWQPFWHELQRGGGLPARSASRASSCGRPAPPRRDTRGSSSSACSTCRRRGGTLAPCSSSPSPSPRTPRSSAPRSRASTGALKPGAPFATAFMAGSDGLPGGGYPLSGPADYPGRRPAALHRTRRERAQRGTARDEAPGTGRVRGNDRGHRFRPRPVTRPESYGDPDTAAHP